MRTPIQAVVFDWAGTMIDFGSFAPMGVFVKAFEHFGVAVTMAHARAPMGLPKWDHIHAMMALPEVAQRWRQQHGRLPSTADIDAVYAVFVPMNEAVVGDFSDLIPGAKASYDLLREKGLKIGSTTGYTRSIMANVLPRAAAQGYQPDNLVCAGDMPQGRPSPMNMYRTFIELNVWPAAAVIKVDDTVPGIREGVEAGCITVGLALSGNEAGLTLAQFVRMGEDEKAAVRARCTATLRAAGADFVIDTVADLPALMRAQGWI